MPKKLTGIKIELKTEVSLDKEGKKNYSLPPKIKCPKCNSEIDFGKRELLFKQHDAIALINLLDGFDSTKYGMSDYKTYLNIRDKIEDAWRKDENCLEPSLDEAVFLKEFLVNYKEKSKSGTQITPFLMRTLVNIVEQLEKF